MSTKLTRSAYEDLIEQDVARVEKEMPDSLERNHVIGVLRHSVEHYYPSDCGEAAPSPSTLEQAKDVAMKATLCAQIMLQNPVVVANEKARHICVDTRDTANRFLADHSNNCPSCTRPASKMMADACGEDPCPLRSESAGGSYVQEPKKIPHPTAEECEAYHKKVNWSCQEQCQLHNRRLLGHEKV